MKAKVIKPAGNRKYKGSIFERPEGSGNFCIRYSAGIDSVTGKYRQIWESGFKSPNEARKRLAALENDKNNNTLSSRNDTLVADYLLRWVQDRQGSISPNTKQHYESVIKFHLIPAFGKLTIGQLKPEHIQRYYSQMLTKGRPDGKGPLTSTTVNHIHTVLHRALRRAVEWRLIVFNPADAGAVEIPKIQHPEVQTMSDSEVKEFLNAARNTPGYTGYYALFYVALMTGARRGELLALRWSDVDLLQAEIHISRAVIQMNDGALIYKTPKNGKGRMVALSPSTSLTLRHHKEQREAFCKSMKWDFDADSLVFCHPDGSSLLPDSITQAWRRLLEKAGMKHLKFHSARHTCATILLAANVHPLVVSQRLGHSKVSTTLDLYSHVKPEMQRAAALQMDKVIVDL